MPSYPLTFPSTPVFSSFNIREIYSTPVSESPFTGELQVFEYTGSGRLQWEATLPPMAIGDTAVNVWIQFLRDLHGRAGTFTLNLQTTTPINYLPGQASVPTLWRSRNAQTSWNINTQRVFSGMIIQAEEA